MRTLALSVHVLSVALAGQAGSSSQEGDTPCKALAFGEHLYVNLESLVEQAGLHAGACLRTKGRLGLRGRGRPQEGEARSPWMMELKDPDSGDSVSITPSGVTERFNRYALSMVGRMVEVAGVFTAGPPPWITFDGYEVAGERTARRRDEILSPCDLVGSADAYLGQEVVVWGPFRGRNTFRDLPDDTRPHAEAWVVGDEDCAVWITGHAPSGKGFSLDGPPAAVRWLKVEGKLERRGETVLLNASKVALAKARD